MTPEDQRDAMLMGALGAARVAEDALTAVANEPYLARRWEKARAAKKRIVELLDPSPYLTLAPPPFDPARLSLVSDDALDAATDGERWDRALGEGRV